MTPAPLDVRVARVLVTPVPFLFYLLIRGPQVTAGGSAPWAEAVVITLLTAVMVPVWLYWCADLMRWEREHARPLTSDELDATEGVFAGELPDVMQGLPKGADGKFAAVPVHRATNYVAQSQLYAREWAAEQHEKLTAAGAVTADGETYLFSTSAHAAVEMAVEYCNPMADPWMTESLRAAGKDPEKLIIDDRPTEPLLLTHEFTPASGIVMSWDPAADGQVCIAQTEDGRVYPVGRVDVVAPERPGRHRAKPRTHLPPIAEVEHADAYSQLNRTRELPF